MRRRAVCDARQLVWSAVALVLFLVIAVSHAQNPPAVPRAGSKPAPRSAAVPASRPARSASRPADRPPASAPGAKVGPARRAGPGPTVAEPAQPQFAAILDDSEEATALLKRAKEAADRQDWKLAIDSLQRIVDLSGDGVLRADEHTYESARRHAHRVIAGLPPAGLDAYRLLYDGEAEARYRRAIEMHDEAALREIVDRFLLTRFGDRAADTLAGWWLDEGRPAAAVSLLRDVLDIYPDSRIPAAVFNAKLALATALAGQPRAAEAMAKAWSTTAPADAVLGTRLVSVRSELGRLQPVLPAEADAWPMAMGSPARAGLMPPVEPSLLDNSPWRANLPHESPGPLDDMYEYQRQTRSLPVMQPVTDGRTIVVKCEGRLLALDAETFDPIWQAVPPSQPLQETNHQRQVVFQQTVSGDPFNWAAAYDRAGRVQRMFVDDVAAAVSLSHGLAFSIARSAESQAFLSELVMREVNPNVFFDESHTVTNLLVAYDLKTGRIRWRCGAGDGVGKPDAAGPPETPEKLSGPVEFLAPPVPVGDSLLVPYRSSSDLYAAVLDPFDGALRRRIYLCGLGASSLNSFEPLHPCVADGVAYIPTGRGVLIALDTATWSIRWAVRYEQGVAQPRTPLRPYPVRPLKRTWLSSPPIAAGGLVLLAPADADCLFAFDRAKGRIVWKIDRGDSLYLLGADSQRGWLVGSGVTQIELETGRRSWRQEVGTPTGRGAVSGKRLYLPTAEYVAVFDAITGAPIDKLDLPTGHAAFGNLLCWDGGFFDCDLKELRRFPDMVRSYERAALAHEHDPSDASSAIRLAWLEMLRDQPSRALTALETVREDTAQDGPRSLRLAGHVAHLRVEAMLALAAMPSTDAKRAESLLQQALQVARLPADAVRTGLAVAERLNRVGKPAEAYRQYAEIALASSAEGPAGGAGRQPAVGSESRSARDVPSPGDVMIDASPGVRRPARFVIADRLVAIEKALDDSQRATIASWLTDMLRLAVRRGTDADLDCVAHMAEAGLLGDVGQRAALQLGVWAQRDERHEEAEYYYEDVIRRGGAAAAVAEALARVALVHLAPDELHMPVTAEREIRRLEKEFAAVSFPASVFEESATGTVNGAEAARRLRSRIDKAVYARHRQETEGLRLGPPGEVAYTAQYLGAAPLQFRSPRPEPLAEVLLLLSNWSEVRAHRVSDGKLLWPATLRLVDETAPAVGLVPSPPVFVGAAGMDLTRGTPRPWAVYDGQVMVINSATGLHAIGLATGLRLWSRPCRAALDSHTASDAFLGVDRGSVLSVDANGAATMSRMIGGESVRWQRDSLNPPLGGWAAVRIRGDFVVAVSKMLTHVSVFRTADGRHLGDMKFQQPDGKESPRVGLAVFDEVICGPADASAVVARELATPGIERWRLRCEQDGKPLAVTGLFKPRPDLLGVGCEMGVVKLVNPADGRVILSAKTGLAGAAVIDGAITDDVLCMYAVGGDDKNAFKVVAIDARDGRLLWHRNPEVGEYWTQLQYAYPLDNSLLRAASNAIPVARLIASGQTAVGRAARELRPMGQREAPQIKLQLTIIDKRTGQSIGQPQTTVLPSTDAMSMIHYVLVWSDRVLVAGDSTYVVFRVGPAPQGAAAHGSVRADPLPVGQGG